MRQSMKATEQPLNRREFIRPGMRGAGAMAAGSAVLAASARVAGSGGVDKQANPFAYDLERYAQTDPRFMQYGQMDRRA